MESTPTNQNLNIHVQVNGEMLDDEIGLPEGRQFLLSLKSSEESVHSHEGHSPRSSRCRSSNRELPLVRENTSGMPAEIELVLSPRPSEGGRSSRSSIFRSPRGPDPHCSTSPRDRRSHTVEGHRRPSVSLANDRRSALRTPHQACDTDHLQGAPVPVEESIRSQSSRPGSGYDRVMDRLSSRDIDLNNDVSISHYRTQSVDRKIRQDIIDGVNYLEKRKDELMVMNKRLQLDVEYMERANEQLQEELEEQQLQCNKLECENDEVKIKLEMLEKEKCRLTEQGQREWKARVKTEEMYVETKRDLEKEIKIMKQKLKSASTAESQQSAQISELKQSKQELNEQLDRLRTEKKQDLVKMDKLETSLDELKTRFDSKCSELKKEQEQFERLEKSFNDLRTEHEHLQRGHKEMSGWVPSSHAAGRTYPHKGPNASWSTNTWSVPASNSMAVPRPAGGETTRPAGRENSRHAGGESIYVVDLTEQFHPGPSLGLNQGRLSRGTVGTGSSTGDDTGSSLPSIKRTKKTSDNLQKQQQQQKNRSQKKQQQLSGAILPPVSNTRQ